MPRARNRKELPDEYALAWLEVTLSEAARRKQLRPLLRGLLTPGQRGELAQRVWIAFLLRAGRSFRAVAAETGASTTTVAAVHRFLITMNPRYRRQVRIRQRGGLPKRRRKPERDPFANPYVPMSGKWLFRELTGTG